MSATFIMQLCRPMVVNSIAVNIVVTSITVVAILCCNSCNGNRNASAFKFKFYDIMSLNKTKNINQVTWGPSNHSRDCNGTT